MYSFTKKHEKITAIRNSGIRGSRASILRGQTSDLLFQGGDVLRGSKAVRFQFIASYRGSLSRSHLCRMMGVTDRGLRAWLRRPPSIRQRRDMVILAHIREQHRLSLGSYGRPRMTEELNELGLRVGQRRVGRLMRQNGIRIIRSERRSSAPPTAITPSTSHRISCNRTLPRAGRTRSGRATSLTSGRARGGSIWL